MHQRDYKNRADDERRVAGPSVAAGHLIFPGTPSGGCSPLHDRCGHPRQTSCKANQRSEIAIPLRSTLAINPTCRPVNDKTAPFSLVSTIAPAPTTTAAPAPAAPYTPATSDGLEMWLTVPTNCVPAAPNTRPALSPPI